MFDKACVEHTKELAKVLPLQETKATLAFTTGFYFLHIHCTFNLLKTSNGFELNFHNIQEFPHQQQGC